MGSAYDHEVVRQLIMDGVPEGPVKANSEVDARPTLLITTVDIGEGRSDKIEIRQGDEPTDAARAFCRRHNLPDAIVEPLTKHILENLIKAASAKALAGEAVSEQPTPDSSHHQRLAPPAGRITEEENEVVDSEEESEVQAHPPSGGAARQPSLDNVTEASEEGGSETDEERKEQGAPQQRAPQASSGAGSEAPAAPPAAAPAPAAPAAQAPQQAPLQHQLLAQHHRTGSGSGNNMLSFSGPNSARAMETLSTKMLPVDPSRDPHLLTVAHDAPGQGGRRGGPAGSGGSHASSMLSGEGRRTSRSAGVSPRDSMVYNRLYTNALDLRTRQEARRKMQAVEENHGIVKDRTSMSWISKEMMRGRTQGPFENYGEMLYAEGLEAKQLRKSKAEAVRSEREARELEGATFAPEVTDLARALWGTGDLARNPVWQRLSVSSKAKTLEKVDEMKRAREEAEIKECTFRPRINPASRAMMAERSETLSALSISAHEQLYQDAERRKQKTQELSTWLPEGVTFKPQVNKSTVALDYLRRSYETVGLAMAQEEAAQAKSPTNSVANSQGTASGVHVVDRLYAHHAKTKAKLEESRARLQGPLDPVTGRQLYKPEVGRGPRSNQVARPADVTVHDLLYQCALELQSKKVSLVEQERRQAEAEAASNYTTANSDRMFRSLKAKRFGQVFTYLDEARVGEVNLVDLARNPTERMDNLDGEVREDVELAAEVLARQHDVALFVPEESEEEPRDVKAVSLAQFSDLMEQALQLRRGPRAYLVPTPSHKSHPEPSFQPTINKRSKDLAQRVRPLDLPAHEVLYHQRVAYQDKIEAMRREREQAALDGCTFAPRLNTGAWSAQEGRVLRIAGVDPLILAAVRSASASPIPSPTKSSTATGSANASGRQSVPQPPRLKQQQQQQQQQQSSQAQQQRRAAAVAAAAAEAEAEAEAAAAEAETVQLAGLDLDDDQFAQMEREVQEALASVEAGQAALRALASNGVTAPGAAAVGGPQKAAGADSTAAVGPGQHGEGGEMDPADLRATEELLLNLMNSDVSDPAADEACLDKLQAYLKGEAPTAEGGVAERVAAATQQHLAAKPQPPAVATAKQADQAEASVFVVSQVEGAGTRAAAQAQAAATAASRMQDLARELGV